MYAPARSRSLIALHKIRAWQLAIDQRVSSSAVPYSVCSRRSCQRYHPIVRHANRTIHRLAAHAAESWTLHVSAFAIGGRWRSICGRQSMLAVIAELPSPASGGSAPSRKRTRQPTGADRMGAPIRIYREPRRRRHERAAECPRQNRRWKDAWQCPIEARERLTISFSLFRLP